MCSPWPVDSRPASCLVCLPRREPRKRSSLILSLFPTLIGRVKASPGCFCVSSLGNRPRRPDKLRSTSDCSRAHLATYRSEVRHPVDPGRRQSEVLESSYIRLKGKRIRMAVRLYPYLSRPSHRAIETPQTIRRRENPRSRFFGGCLRTDASRCRECELANEDIIRIATEYIR